VNYPNDYEFTRVTEFKHLTGQEHPKTSIVYEYSRAEGDPYYPIPRGENSEIYKRYQELASETGVHFVGRLATYKYYNMDQVVAQALTLYARLCNVSRAEATSLKTEPPLRTVTFPLEVKQKRTRTRSLSARRRAILTTP
jgi:UDP-galactopyranose mutase